MTDRYHHGDLRRALLDRTADEVARSGPGAVSLRAIAAVEGVSHAAPRHHFGSREGLLTALAAEGYGLLADALAASRVEHPGDFLEVGLAYVRFSVDHPGHFAVMFDADLVLVDDPALAAARARAFAEIGHGLEQFDDPNSKRDMAAATIAGWSLMHGLVTLHRSEALERSEVVDVLGRPSLLDLAHRAGGMLYGSPTDRPRTDD